VNEEEFDALRPFRPFGTKDAMRVEEQARRSSALGIALWGKATDDLRRQLLAPYPEIPPGFELADFRELLKNLETIAARLVDPRLKLSSLAAVRALYSPIVVVGTQRLTALEARCEIVRRAIEYLENR
jgi:hypothetical protein